MVKLKNSMTAFFLILIFLAAGCSKLTSSTSSKGKTALKDIRTGTDGISLSFLPNNPPDTVHLEENAAKNELTVIVQIDNKGSYPQPEQAKAPSGKLFLSGYDKNILNFNNAYSHDLSKFSLYGKSPINLNGGTDLATFKATINDINVEKYEPVLLATACYNYVTIAGPSVCIDPDPYSTTNQKKVCSVNDITLTNQGAPIAVTSIGEEAFAKKTQFKINIKNVGNGEVLRTTTQPLDSELPSNSVDKCDPYSTASGEDGKITKDDIDKVYLKEASIGQLALTCWPFSGDNIKTEKGFIRLINGEGSIICEYEKFNDEYGGGKTAYTTPLRIVLTYVYKTTAERHLTVKKEQTN